MSACICKPWLCYHLKACPCQAAYEANKPPEPTDDDMATARELVAAGFVQASRKYRRIFKLPEKGMALEQLEFMDPLKAKLLRDRAAQALEAEARAVIWALHIGEERELTPAEFVAFQRAAKE